MFCEFRGRFHCCQVIGVLGILFSQGTRGLQYLVFEERLATQGVCKRNWNGCRTEKGELPGYDHLPKMMRIPALFLRDSNQNPPKPPRKNPGWNLCCIISYGDFVGAFFLGGFRTCFLGGPSSVRPWRCATRCVCVCDFHVGTRW